MRILVPDVFLSFEFQEDRVKNVGAVGGRNFASPIDKAHRLYNSLLLPHKPWGCRQCSILMPWNLQLSVIKCHCLPFSFDEFYVLNKTRFGILASRIWFDLPLWDLRLGFALQDLRFAAYKIWDLVIEIWDLVIEIWTDLPTYGIRTCTTMTSIPTDTTYYTVDQ